MSERRGSLHASKGRLLLQPGWTIEERESGIVVVTEKYHGPRELVLKRWYEWQRGTKAPKGSLIAGIPLNNRKIIGDEGDAAFLECVWAGLAAGGGEGGGGGGGMPPAFWRMVRQPSEEPIDTHPDFDSKLGGTPDNPLNGCQFNKDGTFAGFPAVLRKDYQRRNSDGDTVGPTITDKIVTEAGEISEVSGDTPNPLAGVSRYLVGKAVLQRQYVTKDQPTEAEPLPRKDTPSIAAASARGLKSVPAIPANWQWLKTGREWTERGDVYEISEEWTASGARGWSGLIYPSTVTP